MKFDPTLLLDTGLIALLARGLRQFLSLATRWPAADRWLRWLWVPGIALAGVQLALRLPAEPLKMSLLIGISGVVAYVLFQLRTYRPARTLLLAAGPLMVGIAAEALLELFTPALTKHAESEAGTVIDSAQFFAVVWLIVFINIARREKRTLAQEEARRAEEAAARVAAEARKAELEELVRERTATLRQQATELERALSDLKAAQAQLIQSEKMASLGELTAGIAHEIQNPLNFVTNFADVSTELVTELKAAQDAGDTAEATALADDLSQNLLKITEHGRRAASIVRGMLQHSRVTGGERAATDLNALSDEYLRLAYHGLRAKDKSFNATLQTDFDSTLPQLSIIAPEIGRVLLNLFTNAFYAVRERQRDQPAAYQPTVTVATRRLPQHVEIRVRDNGTGIPAALRTKIFQPFFTTKPTGEGTGLGLSLAYDIITKGHGGSLEVHSQEGAFTEFVLCLPIPHL